MNEAFAADSDADVQFLMRKMHEDKIAGLQLAARDRPSGAQLFARGSAGEEAPAGEPGG